MSLATERALYFELLEKVKRGHIDDRERRLFAILSTQIEPTESETPSAQYEHARRACIDAAVRTLDVALTETPTRMLSDLEWDLLCITARHPTRRGAEEG